jgi:hypothetical protein
VLRWLLHGKRSWKDVVRQQWNFSPSQAVQECEEYHVDLASAAALELSIEPDRKMSIRKRSRSHSSRQRLENEVRSLGVRQAVFECSQQLDLRWLKSMDQRMTRMEAELRELRRTLPRDQAPKP